MPAYGHYTGIGRPGALSSIGPAMTLHATVLLPDGPQDKPEGFYTTSGVGFSLNFRF